MIYFVTTNKEFFKSPNYKIISKEESLDIMENWNLYEFDTETSGLDCHIDKLLLIQFGNLKTNTQIVVDVSCIDIRFYKDFIESKFMIGQNLKFDLKFLYNYNIVPTRVFDTMIAEQFIYLGYPAQAIRYGLKYIAERRLNIHLDKTIREQIITQGVNDSVIVYAANDVKYLEKIMRQQVSHCKARGMMKGLELECLFVPVIAYLEWCGIKLSESKWKAKIKEDRRKLEEAREDLNQYFRKYLDDFPQFFIPDLFEGFHLTINWASSKQVIEVFKKLGFNTKVEDKRKGGFKDSVQEKVIKSQKGIEDEFLKKYLTFKEHEKVCSTYGQNYLNAINPITGRIHTEFRQLGTASGRMACGSNKINVSLARLKKLPTTKRRQKDNSEHCGYPQLQNLPANAATREAFVSEDGNYMLSCDYSALESRLGADIYQEEAMINEFLYGSGDMHSLAAKACFPKELNGIDVKDVKRLRPDLRSKAKAPEFAIQFGGGSFAVASGLGISLEQAQEIVDRFKAAYPGMTTFGEEGHKKVLATGYVEINPVTGHRMYWWDWEHWKKNQAKLNSEFWDKYRSMKDSMPLKEFKKTKESKFVSFQFKVSSKWGRMALNAPTQGSGIIILKDAMIDFYNWILKNNYFGKVLLCNLVHDEAVIEYPKELSSKVAPALKHFMEKAAAKYCKSLPIPAEGEEGLFWIH